jgi:putative SOS response-associated peptidase YedK
MEELLVRYENILDAVPFTPTYYENGFDFKASPVITADKPHAFQLMQWGLIPWWTKSATDAAQIRMRTLNGISEEIFEKPAFKDAAKDGRRCLIPCTGFFEWRWFKGGKIKYPYFIHHRQEAIFSLAGLWSSWTDKSTGEIRETYTVLTTRANPLLEKIHNSKKRMPVVLAREFEKDWLNPNLTQEDVLALCEPINDDALDAYTISKLITDRKTDNKDVPGVCKKFEYPELALLDG